MSALNEVISVQDILDQAGVEEAVLSHWVQLEWISPQQGEEGLIYTRVDLSRALLVRDLIFEMEVNEAGVDVALQLIEQVHGLRRLLLAMRDR
ncbi:chaperone modulator CbpM [Stenotrophomonas maltophilia]|uniref:chaperone modulator CbpM n=1 Tax=Stenotrophomonas maltophilia TaxID=40324 RepID=UPI0028954FF3|nr:chaperone modulator CbpM [Stenotrophomonas maltophilia]MDT3487209.1 chaperone modulator CbpM [Stenotrophomonas maltophilia]